MSICYEINELYKISELFENYIEDILKNNARFQQYSQKVATFENLKNDIQIKEMTPKAKKEDKLLNKIEKEINNVKINRYEINYEWLGRSIVEGIKIYFTRKRKLFSKMLNESQIEIEKLKIVNSFNFKMIKDNLKYYNEQLSNTEYFAYTHEIYYKPQIELIRENYINDTYYLQNKLSIVLSNLDIQFNIMEYHKKNIGLGQAKENIKNHVLNYINSTITPKAIVDIDKEIKELEKKLATFEK